MNLRKIVPVLTALGAAAGHNGIAQADISYSQRVVVEAGGAMSMFSSEGDVLVQIAGDKSRSQSDVRMQSGLLNSLMDTGRTANIVRLDKQLTWSLQPDEKRYSELTFAELRAQMQQASQSLPQGSDGALPVSEEACKIDEGNLQVEHPRGTERVASIKTKRHIVNLTQTCTDPDSGKTCDITWRMETWLAKKVPAQKEALAFQQAYAKALGVGDAVQHLQGTGQALVSMFAGSWEKVVDEFDKMEGYPLRTTMQMGIGGEDCTTASGQPIALDEVWADATTSAYNAALDQASVEAGDAAGRAVGESFGDSIGGSIGGAAVGAAAGEIIGGLAGMFKKSKPDRSEPAEAPPATADGQVTVFRISTEVTDWSEVTIPAETFDIPPGYQPL